MARRECAMAALFRAERIGGLASLQPATLTLAADVRYGGHSRRSDAQQGFAECPLCLQWRPNLCVTTNRRDVPTTDIAHRAVRYLYAPSGSRWPTCLRRLRCVERTRSRITLPRSDPGRSAGPVTGRRRDPR